MSSDEIDKLKIEKLDLINQYISLKKVHQEMFYKYKTVMCENEKLKAEVEKLQSENVELKNNISVIDSSTNQQSLLRENKNLIAIVKQMRRDSVPNMTPKKTPMKTPKKDSPKFNARSKIYEVEQLLKHRGRKGDREFMVRWVNYGPEDDTWERESNLMCPKILQLYKKQHRLH